MEPFFKMALILAVKPEKAEQHALAGGTQQGNQYLGWAK